MAVAADADESAVESGAGQVGRDQPGALGCQARADLRAQAAAGSGDEHASVDISHELNLVQVCCSLSTKFEERCAG